MTTVPEVAMPSASASATDRRRPGGFLRRHRIWFFAAAALLLAMAVGVWASRDDAEYPGALDPQNPDPEGAQALAQVLADEGVDVTVVRSADELHDADVGPRTTVVVTSSDQLAQSTISRLRRDTSGAALVLVDPPHHVVAQAELGTERSSADDETTGDCDDERFDDLSLAVDSAYAYDTPTGCFESGGGFVLALGEADTTYFGAGQALSNDQVLRADNAAVALRLLGGHERLVWYVPTYDDARDDEAVSLWTFAPEWLEPSLWLSLFAAAALLWWRGRRLGRLAVEPLPVAVRAVETTRSRGRMYRRADARAYAAAALRAAARRRLSDSLRLGRAATEAEVVAAVARHLQRSEEDVGALLTQAAPAPTSDQGLVRLANDLTQLDREVRRA